jgi:phosphoserine phosphatase
MAEFPFRLVSFDIDGTLTVGHGWRYIADSLGRTRAYEATQRRFLSGEQGEDEHLRALLRIAEGLPLERLSPILEATPRVDGIRETVTALVSAGVVPVLLTHNPGYVSDWYVDRFGFAASDGTVGGPSSWVRDGRIVGPGELRVDKLGGLDRLLRRFDVPASAAAHLGDSRPDVEIFPRVAFGVAVNPTDPQTAAAADALIRTNDLQEVLPLLRHAPVRVPRRQVL